ncbi:interleukin-34 [Neoarius graeffei]|uniref:interleukin-34 n=1 Tax=Neoarius graeffei TaxID=443677 RepID=UPI00298CE7A3|nr:interleukin-34 [Neoarius graeffei]XP_060779833.1 interleukin-34 [Neoarius graeffei]XP_060779835.1 interleukin-34 [Neoarius graeffei]
MVRFEAWILNGLLGLMWAVPIWMSSEELCTSLETLKDELSSTLRKRYLKHNFPINYTIQVRYEEVFRLKNISRLMNDSADMKDLQDLWVKITETSIKSILQVLPERHPTRRKYLANLDSLFTAIQSNYPKENFDEKEHPESIENIWKQLGDPDYPRQKSVTPKSLLDNCYRTMHCLFEDCFSKNGSQYDYCNTQHWRKGKGTQG